MIKVNLATRKQAGTGGGVKGGAAAGATKTSLSSLKELPIRKVAVPLMVGVFASFLLDNYKDEEMSKLEVILTKATTDGAKYQADALKFKVYEPVKKSLDEDELTIRTKLEVIRKITTDRISPAKFLVSIANAIPTEVWLSEFKVEKSDVIFKGAAMGFGQISDFMKNLNENAFFLGVELKNSQQDREGSVEIASFELKGKRR